MATLTRPSLVADPALTDRALEDLVLEAFWTGDE